MTGSATLPQVVTHRAANEGDRVAYTFLADGAADARSLTWSQLDWRARTIGASLRDAGATGQPVLLALPSGLAFVESLFACWYAGAIAVPVSLPRHQRVKHRLDRIVADAGARFAMGNADIRERLNVDLADVVAKTGLTWINPSQTHDGALKDIADMTGDDLAVLQYTSGSTVDPRGVMVTHTNLMANSAIIAEACGHTAHDTIGGWLPLFHDMGLVGMLIQAAYTGARLVFMAPERFLMRPRQWLAMISEYGICSSPAPNFAYDLCVDKITPDQMAGLDLSCWRNALNGSEPVRAATLDRFARAFAPCGFRREAFFPCYGLAEATLFVSGPGRDRSLVRRAADGTLLSEVETLAHIGCGGTIGDVRIEIVDPQTLTPVALGAVGEIWVAGASIAKGYWNNPEASAATFGARMNEALQAHACGTGCQPMLPRSEGATPVSPVVAASRQTGAACLARTKCRGKCSSLSSCHRRSAQEPAVTGWKPVPRDAEQVIGDGTFLRTGDLGFIADSHLFITGRRRELIIIAGRNHFPVDLERTVEAADPAIATSGVVAFSRAVDGVERLFVAAEIRREYANPARTDTPPAIDPDAIIRRFRAALAAEHEVTPHEVVLLKPGALPRTTSGKLSHRGTHDAYLNNTLERYTDAHVHAHR